MLEGLRPQVTGEMAESIVTEVSAQADKTVREWLVSAIEIWAAEDFERYSDGETSCTARIFHWCEELKRERGGYYLLYHVSCDGLALTPGMRLGKESPKSAGKPDLTISVGNTKLHIEAKLLKPRPPRGLPLDYVKNGMMRFISGYYPSVPGIPCIMVSYVLEEAVAVSYDAVNEVIINYDTLGTEDSVKHLEQLGEKTQLYESMHDSCSIAHFAIDLNGRRQSTEQLLAAKKRSEQDETSRRRKGRPGGSDEDQGVEAPAVARGRRRTRRSDARSSD
jgi:hypothetical protein